MNKTIKILIVIVLVVVVGIVFALKQNSKSADSNPLATENNPQETKNQKDAETTVNLPRLVDLGADKCIPCKMMAPILEELKTEYAAVLNVEFIDVWKNPDAGQKYGIRVIPTQIFYDASGKELFRHEGFFSKEDILAKWKKIGVTLEKGTNNATN